LGLFDRVVFDRDVFDRDDFELLDSLAGIGYPPFCDLPLFARRLFDFFIAIYYCYTLHTHKYYATLRYAALRYA
jgi:hypothetical protein